MRKVREKIWAIILVGLAGEIVWGFSRGFVFKKLLPVSDPSDFTAYGASYLTTHGLFFPVLGIIGLVALTWYVAAFVLIEPGLPGGTSVKGFIYGFSFLAMYVAAFFEFYRFFHGSAADALRAGIADGTPLLVTGLLAAIVLGTRSSAGGLRPARYLVALFFIPAFFLLGRIAFYTVVFPSPLVFHPGSLGLIATYGAAIGVSYYLLSRGIRTADFRLVPFYYALILLPVSLSGNIVVCLRYRFPLGIMVLLTAIDMVAVVAGGLATEFACAGRPESAARRV